MTIDLEAIFGEPSQARAAVTIAEPATLPGMEAPHLGPGGWPADTVDPDNPCPACGSLEKWRDIQGNEHCGHCEADKLRRSRKLANQAADLRRRNPSRQNRAPGVARVAMQAAEPTGTALGTSGDSRAVCGLLRGCENG